MKVNFRVITIISVFALLCSFFAGCNESTNEISGTSNLETVSETLEESSSGDSGIISGKARDFSVASGRAEMVPNESRLWSEDYVKDSDEWISVDCVDVKTVVSTYGKSLQTLYTNKDVVFDYSENLAFRKIQVFSKHGDELELEGNSLDEVNKLPCGTFWTVAVTMVYSGDYITAHQKHETMGVLYTFRVVVFPTAEEEKTYFCGNIKEINENRALVAPYKGGFESQSDVIDVYLGKEHDFAVGDAITVRYDGTMLETDPPRPQSIESVEHYNGKFVAVNGVGYDAEQCPVGSKTWREDEKGNKGWVYSDGAGCKAPKNMTEQERNAVPVILKAGKIVFALTDADNASITVYDGETLEACNYPKGDLAVVNELLKGEYFVMISVSSRGRFIEEAATSPRDAFLTDEDFYKANQNAYETDAREYMFKLIVE